MSDKTGFNPRKHCAPKLGGALEANILENLTLIFRNTRILSIEDGYTGTADGIDHADARAFLTLSTIASGVRHIASLGESQT